MPRRLRRKLRRNARVHSTVDGRSASTGQYTTSQSFELSGAFGEFLVTVASDDEDESDYDDSSTEHSGVIETDAEMRGAIETGAEMGGAIETGAEMGGAIDTTAEMGGANESDAEMKEEEMDGGSDPIEVDNGVDDYDSDDDSNEAPRRIPLQRCYPPLVREHSAVDIMVVPKLGYGKKYCVPLMHLATAFKDPKQWKEFETYIKYWVKQQRTDDDAAVILQTIRNVKERRDFAEFKGAFICIKANLDSAEHNAVAHVLDTDDVFDHPCVVRHFKGVLIQYIDMSEEKETTTKMDAFSDEWLDGGTAAFRLLLNATEAHSYESHSPRLLQMTLRWKLAELEKLNFKLNVAMDATESERSYKYLLKTSGNKLFSRNLRRTRANKKDELLLGFRSKEDWKALCDWLHFTFALGVQKGRGKNEVVKIKNGDCKSTFGRGYKSATTGGGFFRISNVELEWSSVSTLMKLKCESQYVNANGLTA